MDAALKKLRIKFVGIIMAIVFAVLAVAFTTICAISYVQGTSEVYDALESAIMRDAAPGGAFRLDGPEGRDFGKGPLRGDFDGVPEHSKGFEIGARRDGPFIPVAVFRIEADGSLSIASNVTTGSMSDDVIAEAASRIGFLPEGRGTIASPPVFYIKRSVGGATYVAFADEGSAAEWKSLALTLTAVGLGAMLVFFAGALAFSKWALRPVEESWLRQQQFVADASHELKTPLTVMAADAAILSRNPEKTISSQSQWVESMQSEISAMQELVGDMLALASADAGAEDERDIGPIDLSKLVEGQMLQLESLAYERGVDTHASIAEGVWVEGSSEGVRRIVGTLLDNAYKYAGSGGRVGVELQGSPVKRFSVSNSGTVIPKEDIPHVFDRFYRVDKARGRDSERSYGLGLAIAKRSAEAMGAEMSVASSEAEGTTFTVTFP